MNYRRKSFGDEIITSVGAGFSVGLFASSIMQFVEGVHNSPKNNTISRLSWGSQAVRMNAPRYGGRIAAFCFLYSGVENSLIYIREKEDCWTRMVAGGAAMGCLNMRRGLETATISVVVCALVCGVLGQARHKTS
ncbi:hypothetical protein AQUCO_00100042v1 [Aquilegia coerulea]|uniref:Mitochondrial import inner membrane translocase subunit TIM22 n=1 Tax=Aquilegia coerulea TaxID=218851 RepID=A0A2G5F8M2_AQUCA|nr:hypothetical protein AQUCO_00100042v1 [Aquilegia coerulea]